MFLGILVLLTGLTISAVAIYYSVAGLVAIFAAAAIPIIIMGGALEIAKLVTAVWLHRYWNQAAWWLKTYLSIAVIVLMFITSMGIFGFLSKAHIDQTANAKEGLARIEQLDVQIVRQQTIIDDARSAIEKAETAGTNRDSEIQSQIDREQIRIDSAYERIQPAIDEQNIIIAKEEERLGTSVILYKDLVDEIDRNLKSIEENITSNNVKAVQALVGVEADGNLGPATERAIEAFRTSQLAEKQRLTNLISVESAKITSPVIDTARAEIQRLRGLAEQEIENSNELINRLRQQLGTTDNDQVSIEIEKQNTIIENAEIEIVKLSEQKFGLESEYRKLEAEVGPIKYLAEFVYGNAEDKDLLEEAVRWVIILIIFVFDPLAVLLLIASQYTFEYNRLNNNSGDRLRQKDDDIKDESIRQKETDEEEEGNQPVTLYSSFGTGHERRDSAYGMVVAQQGVTNDKSMEEDHTGEHAGVRELVPENSVSDDVVAEQSVEQDQIQVDGLVRQVIESFVDRTDDELLESEEEQKRRAVYDAKEQNETFILSKTQWKEDNPDKTLKHYKNLYIAGIIDHLPWEETDQKDNYNGYQQNSEQNENTLFNKLKNR